MRASRNHLAGGPLSLSKKIFDKLVDGEASSPATATLSSFCLNPTDSGRKNCREMMDWLVETVQEYEIPFEPDATTLQNLPDLLMREAENNDMAHQFVLMYRSVELQPVFQEVLKSGDTSLRGQLACAGLNDYLNWYLIDDDPISQGMAEELFELIREWRKLQ